MESQLSVLLYSKYSSLSKKLMNIIQTSGVDFTAKFSLQPLCIDNEKIRTRVIQNTNIEVTTVPCLLIIFPDGGIEKYDGAHIFEWVEGIIRQSAPPPPPPQHIHSEEDEWHRQQAQKQKQLLDQKQSKNNERKRITAENRRKYEEKYEEPHPSSTRQRRSPSHSTQSTHTRSRVRKESRRERGDEREESGDEREELGVHVTSIDDLEDLPSDEDDELSADRYRSRRPIGRIRTDEGNYEEDEDLFQGPPPNMRKARRSAVKGGNHDATTQKSLDIMAKAKAMAKGREEPPAPAGHPGLPRN